MTTKTKAITAKEVGELRNRTGAGMMDCKKALEQTNGDMDAAIEMLRKSGAAKAEKRVGRTASEGLVGSYIHHNGKIGVIVEVNCETDFVARTDDFRNLVKSIAEHIAAAAPLAVDKDGIPAEKIESERRIATEQVKESGKPAHLVRSRCQSLPHLPARTRRPMRRITITWPCCLPVRGRDTRSPTYASCRT